MENAVKKNGMDQCFLTDEAISNLLGSFNICDIEFQRHLSKETRSDLCHCQEAELKGKESGYIFNIGICSLSGYPSRQEIEDLISWTEKDHHFSFILYSHEFKEGDVKEISGRIREKNESGAKIFLAKMRPYRLLNSPYVGRTILLSEGPLNDLQKNLTNLHFNRTTEEWEFWRLIPPDLFEVDSKRPGGLEREFFRLSTEDGLKGTSGWASDGIWITLEGEDYNHMLLLHNFGVPTFRDVFPGGIIAFHRKRGRLHFRINGVSLKDFALSNSNGKKGFIDFMVSERQRFIDWLRTLEGIVKKSSIKK